MEHRQELNDIVKPLFAGDTTQAWLDRLLALGLPAGKLMDIAEVFEDPQVQHNHMQVELSRGTPVTGSPVQIDGAPAIAMAEPPRLGADTDQVLRDLGATDEILERLEAARLIVRT